MNSIYLLIVIEHSFKISLSSKLNYYYILVLADSTRISLIVFHFGLNYEITTVSGSSI